VSKKEMENEKKRCHLHKRRRWMSKEEGEE
jgi:hypothetical protein